VLFTDHVSPAPDVLPAVTATKDLNRTLYASFAEHVD
jgi:hypothetical protein